MSEKSYEFIDEIAVRYLQEVLSGVSNTGVQTGFIDLDYKTGGFHKGEVTVVAARPAMGKTAFALSAARILSVKNKRPVLLFSLELSKEQIAARVLSAEAKVDCSMAMTGHVSTRDKVCLEMNCDAIKGAKLIIDDTPGLTIGEICARSSELKKEHGIELVIIDYLQLICTDDHQVSKKNEIAEIGWKLKTLAKELEIPVVVLSQLSRKVEHRDNHRPLLSDLGATGLAEQYADTVMFLYRDKYYNKYTKYGEITELIIAKQRNGSRGTVFLEWHPEFAEFTDFDGILPTTTKTPDEIIEAICNEFCVNREDLMSKKRRADLVLPRQVIMYLCREYTDMSLDEIGEALGKRDHVTVISGVEKIKNMLSRDEQLSERIRHIVNSIG